MACCSMGHESCEHAGAAMDCCKKTEPPQQQFFAAKADPFNAPIRHVLVSLTTALPVDFGAVVALAPVYRDTSPPRLVGPPSYIAFETLLI